MKIAIRIFWIVVSCTFMFPFYWMLTTSFKTKDEAYNNPYGIPQTWDWHNFSDALSQYHFYTYLQNSLIYTVGTIVVTLASGSMLAYCLSRMQWRFSSAALFYVSLGLIVPIEVVIIPLFQLVKLFHIKDSYLGLILPYSGFSIASCVLMLYAFLRSLPKEVEEAACIDGANVYQTFRKVILPIVMPALVTQCVLVFMRIWNEFPLAFVLASRDQFRPLTVGLLNFFVSVGVSDWGLIGASMLLTSLPTIIVYLIGNEKIENALTAGAILK